MWKKWIATVVLGGIAACQAGGAGSTDSPQPEGKGLATEPAQEQVAEAEPVGGDASETGALTRLPEDETALLQRFEHFLQGKQQCERSEECSVIMPGCPLGCYTAVHQDFASAAEQEAERLIGQFQSETGQAPCAYSCIAIAGVTCNAGQCETCLSEDEGCVEPVAAAEQGPIACHATAVPDEDWTRYPTDCGFSLLLPAGFSELEVQPLDSCVTRLQSDQCELSADYGWYGDGFAGRGHPVHVDGRAGRLMLEELAETESRPYVAGLYLPDGEQNSLSMRLACDTAAERDRLLPMLESVDLN